MISGFRRYSGYGLALASVLILVILAASCSAAPAATTSPPTTTAPTTESAATNSPGSASPTDTIQRQGTAGTLTAINGNTLMVTNLQGTQVTVNVGENVAIQKTVAGNSSDLKQGELVTVVGDQDASGNITATSISIRAQELSTPPPEATLIPPTRTFRQGSGTGSGAPGGSPFRGIIGTVKSVSGDTLNITALQGNDMAVKINDSTSIQKTVAGTMADLQQGQSITVVGSVDASGVVSASQISIRPEGQNFPAPTPGT